MTKCCEHKWGRYNVTGQPVSGDQSIVAFSFCEMCLIVTFRDKDGKVFHIVGGELVIDEE